MKQIINIGVLDGYPNFLKRKIQLSNQIALLLFPLCIPYLLFSMANFSGTAIFPIAVMVNSVLVFLFNSIHWNKFSRFLESAVVNYSVLGYHSFLLVEGDPLIVSLSLIHFSLLMLPLLVFDPREQWILYVTLIVCLISFLGVSFAAQFSALDVDSSIFRVGWIGIVGMVIAVVILLVSLSVLIRSNLATELNNEKLVEEMDSHNRQLKESEEALQANIEKLKIAQEDDRRRNWAAEGQAVFGELLRKDNEDMKKLCKTLIAELVRYMQVNQGSLFILNEEDPKDPFLELMACYAYDRQKYLTKRINIGEGLVGQVYLERKASLLREVPEGYLKITSGLGAATPDTLVIVPIMTDHIVLGVVELASFHEIQQYEVDFVVKLGESIAATLINVRTNEKTKRLLAETTEKSEELRAHDEEMRQNMEELTATQEELERQVKESEELKVIIEKNVKVRDYVLDQTIGFVEFDQSGLVTHVNKNFTETLGYCPDEVQQKRIDQYWFPDMPHDLIGFILGRLAGGDMVKGVIKSKTKTGGYQWAETTWVPIKSNQKDGSYYAATYYFLNNPEFAEKSYKKWIEKIGVSA